MTSETGRRGLKQESRLEKQPAQTEQIQSVGQFYFLEERFIFFGRHGANGAQADQHQSQQQNTDHNV